MTTLRAAVSARGSVPPAIRPLAWAALCALALPAALATGQPLAAAPAKKSQATGKEQTVMLNFVGADLEAVVRAIGQFTGRQFVIDPRVKGTINLVTERPVTKQQAYEQLLSALRLQGFTIVESPQPGGIARILPEADAKLQGGRVVAPSAAAPRGDQIVTQVFQLSYESATNLVPILRPLIAPNNTISAYGANNALVITDYADNLRRIAQIIAAIDQPGAADAEIVPLKHGLAVEIAAIATRVLDEGARAAGQAVDAGQRVQVLAEPRTNSLIVRTASRARLFLAKQFIEKLDQPSLTPGNINVVYLRNAEATKLAPLLRAIIAADPSFVPPSADSGLAPAAAPPGRPGLPAAAAPAPAPTAIGAAGGGQLGGMIQADAATNSLIINAPEPLYRNLRSIIEKLDVRRAQVVIESLIVEVTADKAAEFGIQWQALGGLRGDETSLIGGTNFGGPGQNIVGGAQNLASLRQGLNLGVIRGRVTIPGIGEVTNLGFLARALETSANGNVLSTPTIQTLDNEEARFLVGQNVPFITGQYAGTGAGQPPGAINPFQTFERRDVGIQLRVKPQISEGGVVRLSIYQEVSSVQPGTIAGGLITNKRSIESSVLVEDGNIVVLGGLIEDRTTGGVSQVPLLGSLPVIGNLFRYENRERKKTNLLVFLRPYVVRDETTSSTLAVDRYDYMRAQIAEGQKPDTLLFRGLQGADLPPLPPARRAAPPPTSPSPAPQRDPAPAPTSAEPAAPHAQAPTRTEEPPAAPASAASTTAAPSSRTAGPASGAFAAVPGATPPASGIQLIQVAAVSDIGKGRELQRRLRAAGFDAYWESVRRGNGAGEIVRVRVAVDRARQSVADTIAELKKRGFEPTLVNP